MPHISNQNVTFWEDVEQNVRRSCLKRRGTDLTERQANILLDCYVLLMLAWHDLLSSLEGYNVRWVKPWLKCLLSLDVEVVVKLLKDADSFLLNSVAEPASSKQFKAAMRASCPVSGDLLGPLTRAITGWFDESDHLSFSILHTCLCFITRVNLPDLQDLIEEARASYIAEEESIMTSGFSTEEREIFSQWFPVSYEGQLYADFRGRHGPGAVADVKLLTWIDNKKVIHDERKRSIEQKYKAMATDARVNYLLLRLGVEGRLPAGCGDKKLSRTAKVTFVAKSIDKLRTICMEPTTLMWYQQGFSRAIEMVFRNRHHYLSKRINLESQENSRQLARRGSILGNFATIDLSSASDSISWPMVREWTSKSCLRQVVLCTRSTMIRGKGIKPMKTNKFAPMGSALCFPMECIVFCAITEAAIRGVGGNPHSSDYCVYGDDIIVETEYADAVVRRLERNGFTVNKRKTFLKRSTHNFRESCGGEYLDGVDVSPLRISRKFEGFSKLSASNPSQLAGCISLCNRVYGRLPSVRLRILKELLALPQDLRPLFSSDERFGIFSPEPTNHHLANPIWNSFSNNKMRSDYQRFEVKHGAIRTKPSKLKEDEDIRYFECLRLMHCREKSTIQEDDSRVSIKPPGSERWITVRSPSERYCADFLCSITQRRNMGANER